jgi:hypothetical protein
MKFRVETQNGGFDFEGTYAIDDAGVLLVKQADPKVTTRFSPMYWHAVEHATPKLKPARIVTLR